MKTIIIKINLKDNSYPIYVDCPLKKIGAKIKGKKYGKKVLIVSDNNVFPIYGNILKESIINTGKEVFEIILTSGEKTKNFEELIKILEICGKNKMSRDDTIITLGGGVVSDIGGFASAIYMRGINFVAIPTTLLSQVDAAVGGKTAINLPYGKNLVGTFYQPSLVCIDITTLKTLPEKEVKQGLSEIIKYGIIKNKKIFTLIENSNSEIQDNYKFLITESINIKKDVVEKDEKETKGLREILNFGHTIGHAIEISHFPQFNHGEAVALGMVGESYISYQLGICNKDIFIRIKNLITKKGLPSSFKNIDIKKMIQFLSYDKKVRQGQIRFVLPKKIGAVKIGIPLTLKEVEKILKTI
jgi:3-dehydroquinate synthase